MKTRRFLMVAAVALFALSACSKEDNGLDVQMNEAVASAFSKLYPEAVNVQWNARGAYQVATFHQPQMVKAAAGEEIDAWFSGAGQFMMEAVEIDPEDLPAAVADALAASAYAGWEIDDVDLVTRPQYNESMYIIEVEDGEEEFDLYFTQDGILFKEVADEDGEDYDDDMEDLLVTELDQSILDCIAGFFQGAAIVEAELEDDGTLEVEAITADRLEVEFEFRNGAFVQYELESTEEAFLAEFGDLFHADFQGWEIDEVSLVVSAEGGELVRHFEVEIEKDGEEDEVIF